MNNQTVSYNGAIPKDGPQAVAVSIEFKADGQIQHLDLSQLIAQGRISGIQTIFVDATETPNITIEAQDTLQKIIAPSGTQGYYPIMSGNGKFNISSDIDKTVTMQFLNFAVAQSTWYTRPRVAFNSGALVIEGDRVSIDIATNIQFFARMRDAGVTIGMRAKTGTEAVDYRMQELWDSDSVGSEFAEDFVIDDTPDGYNIIYNYGTDSSEFIDLKIREIRTGQCWQCTAFISAAGARTTLYATKLN